MPRLRPAARLLAAVMAMAALPLTSVGRLQAQQEVPPPTPNLQIIKSGALVIAMDNDKQNVGRPFNTRAYGLAVALLYDSIPVKWIIRTGKGKDGIDFSATASRYAPDTVAAALLDFRGGPFVIDRAYEAKVRARILAYNALSTAKVRVYKLTQDVTADVRYVLHFKPYPFVNTTNTALAADVLTAAGITNYHVGPNSDVGGATSCYTILLEPHNTNTSDSLEVRQFVQSGGNFYAQCASVASFENVGLFATTHGLAVANTGTAPTYPNPDMAYSQFVGLVEPAPGGSEQDFALRNVLGNALRPNTSIHLQTTATIWAALQTKVAAPTAVGGIVFYNGGHDVRSTSDILQINLQRLMLDAVMTPANRPSVCSFDIPAPDLTVAKSHTGDFTAGATGTYTITVSNVGNAATLDTIYVRDTLPAGFTYVSASGTGWTFSVTGQVVVAKYAAALPAPGSASFDLVVSVAPEASGTITNRAWVNGGGEANDTNNGASDPTTVLVPGVIVTPDSAGPVLHLPSNGVAYSYTFTVRNSGTAATPYLLVASLATVPTPVLAIDSITGVGVTPGASADSASLDTLAAGDSATVTLWFRVEDVEAALRQLLVLLARSTIATAVSDIGSVFIEVVRPALAIDKQVTPDSLPPPGTDLNYTVVVQNTGTEAAMAVVVVDSLPPEVMFKIGSIVSTVPSGSVTIEYSSDDGATWTYVPVSAGCGAPAGYDGCITRIRWTMADPLAFTEGTNTATHALVARLR